MTDEPQAPDYCIVCGAQPRSGYTTWDYSPRCKRCWAMEIRNEKDEYPCADCGRKTTQASQNLKSPWDEKPRCAPCSRSPESRAAREEFFQYLRSLI